MHRRTFLVTTAGVSIPLIAGCSGSEGDSGDGGDGGGESNDGYQSGDNGSNDNEAESSDGETENSSDSEDENQSQDQEELDAEEVENREEGTDVLEFGDLAIVEHEEQIEEREYGDDQLIISGVVENRDDEMYDSVTVGVRAYNDDGHQIDRYLDTTSDLQGGGTWQFEVKIYDVPAEDVAEWDIGVSGHQF